jgi:hypothetical protein
MKPGWKLLLETFPDARLLWDSPGPQMTHGRSELRAYSINGRVFIVQEYGGGDGWQVFAPVTESSDIKLTLGSVYARAHGLDYDYKAGGE